MTIKVLDQLINKQDTFELVRDKLAQILKDEFTNQMALATAASLDPKDYEVRVFRERIRPWQEWLDDEPEFTTPIINVWYDRFDTLGNAGNVVEKQQGVGRFIIDCYGYGVTKDLPNGGHESGDRVAAFEAHRCVRLARNIIMAGINTYLQCQGLVGKRWIPNITAFQPQQDSTAIQNILGGRIILDVTLVEYSPQTLPGTLNELFIEIKESDTGEILATAEYDYSGA